MNKVKLNLTVKILACVLIPIIILGGFSVSAIRDVGMLMADRLQEDHLITSNYAVRDRLSAISTVPLRLEGENLYLGELNLTEDSSMIDRFKENSGVEVTFFYGKTRRATTITGSDGKRILGTDMSDTLYSQIKADGYYFSDNVSVEGEPYYGVYTLMKDYGPGNEVIVFTGISVENTLAIYSQRLNTTVAFMVVVAVICLLIAQLVVRGIVKNIKASVADLNEVADGKLNFTVNEKMTARGDEVGNIARSIDSLMKKFIGIVDNLNVSSDTLVDFSDSIRTNFEAINESISNINIAVDEIANGATSQANETQSVAEQMNEMGYAVEKATDSIVTLKQSTEGMETSNNAVRATLDELVKISTTTRESIEVVQKQTDDTNQSVAKIQDAIALISNIAGQTNLLSLNASIEAARAGEQGRGFAVVADEVRKLAEQSSESAEQINSIVQQLIDQSNSNVAAMRAVTDKIQTQYDKLTQTQDVFGNLNIEIGNVANAVDSIAGEIENINRAKNEVYSNLESLAAISEQNAASTEETAATMAQLSELVNECDNSVGKLGSISDSLEDNVKKFTL
ncbi:MAG: methyl-accepting chemotaxis protein [Lachnospiraceae bacterium]|nr:methyl-accepting chemotaxis protein [Lachnospiraceae bacterium]